MRYLSKAEANSLIGLEVPETIYSIKRYLVSTFDWLPLMERDCFPRNIRPTDLDGIIDNDGQFMVLERKALGTLVPKGQDILFRNLHKTGFFTIVLVWGDYEKIEFLAPGHTVWGGLENIDALADYIKTWFTN